MSNRVPVSRRIADDIRAQIASGELAPGAELPSIDALAKLYDCSTTPVKRALLELQLQNLIEGRPGKGNYVLGQPTAKDPT